MAKKARTPKPRVIRPPLHCRWSPLQSLVRVRPGSPRLIEMLIPGDHAPFGIREVALALFLLEGLEKLGTVHCHAAYYTISAALATGYLTVALRERSGGSR